MKWTHRKNRQAGVTLMELIAALAVMAVIIVGALSLYTSASTSEKVNTLNQDTRALQAAVRSLYSGQGTYGAVGKKLNNILVTAKRVPSTIKVDTTATPYTMTHAANGNVDVVSTGNSFEVQLTNITPELCVPLMTGASGWTSVRVGATAGGGTPRTPPVDPNTAATDCNASGATFLTFLN